MTANGQSKNHQLSPHRHGTTTTSTGNQPSDCFNAVLFPKSDVVRTGCLSFILRNMPSKASKLILPGIASSSRNAVSATNASHNEAKAHRPLMGAPF